MTSKCHGALTLLACFLLGLILHVILNQGIIRFFSSFEFEICVEQYIHYYKQTQNEEKKPMIRTTFWQGSGIVQLF